MAKMVCIHGKRPDEICDRCPGQDQRDFYSTQAVRRAKLLADDRCADCGKKRNESPYKRKCIKCGQNPARWKRIRTGSKKWEEGKRGAPPLTMRRNVATSEEKA